MNKLIKEHVWANLGWFFCEIAFRCPEWLWWGVGYWSHSLGNWFYKLAYYGNEEKIDG